LSPRLNGEQLRRAVLTAMGDVMTRLGVEAEHVIFGHSHRAGPLPADDPGEWTTRSGAHLHNSGSWVYQRHFVTAAGSQGPYWPGTAIRVVPGRVPELVSLLGDKSRNDFASAVKRARAAQ
jgi:hypothetical protein